MAEQQHDVKREIMAGYLVASGEQRPYTTTADTCTCPDRQYRGVVCKHMIAARMLAPKVTPTAEPIAPKSCTCGVYVLRGSCRHVDADGTADAL